MQRFDGSQGARARSARIRSAHDDEATRLDSMARRTASADANGERLRLAPRLRAAWSRLAARGADGSAHGALPVDKAEAVLEGDAAAVTAASV